MKIALIQETKHPVDNRVALTPEQMALLQRDYPDDQFVVQSCELRAYDDDQYRAAGIPVVDDVSDCDVLMGIKEVKLECLLPRKHYFFFGHFAKMQAYNLPLVKTLMEREITFTDYEYLVDEKGLRVCASARSAGGQALWASITPSAAMGCATISTNCRPPTAPSPWRALSDC